MFMYECSISLENFRNFESLKLDFNERINIISGNNGSGKTSLLEAIFFSIFGSSFREKERKTLITLGKEYLKVEFIYRGNLLEAYMDIYGRKVLKLNNKVSRRRDITSKFFAVYSIGKENLLDGPQHERRKILDKLSSVMYSEYRSFLSKYQKALSIKRNAIFSGDLATLIAANKKIWELYNKMVQARENTLSELQRIAAIEGINNIEFSYVRSIDNEEVLYQNAKREIDEGKVLYGLNADEISVTVSGMDVRSFYSHGIKAYIWQRIFIQFIRMVANKSGKTVFLLMDEPFSVLDNERIVRLIDSLDEGEEEVVYFFTTQHKLNLGVYLVDLSHGRIKADV